MKRVNVQIMKDGYYADYVVWMENDFIYIETSDNQGGVDLWKFAKMMTNANKILGCGCGNGKYEDFQVHMQMNKGFGGIIEAVYILTMFNAAEEISLSGII
ncbi:MAG TPA: hypothetical protein PLJ19_01215 [Dysgonamonadaceae bacterium]|jgi:hypothetical protein|nr:hypothetical protein [Dysgonamonadaceae bacterium]